MKTFEYLENLPLTANQKQKITELALGSPLELYKYLTAHPGESALEAGYTSEVLRHLLWGMLTPAQREVIRRNSPKPVSLSPTPPSDNDGLALLASAFVFLAAILFLLALLHN